MEILQTRPMLTVLRKIFFVSKETFLSRTGLIKEMLLIPILVRNPAAWEDVTAFSELWLLTDIMASDTTAGIAVDIRVDS